MKKEKIQVFRYQEIDSDLNEIILLHKLIFKSSSLNEKLIYFDSNFPSFFQKLVLNSRENVVTILKVDNQLAGFIHFKILDNAVFLNNICIHDKFQDIGLGKFFLKESLVLVPDKKIEYFMLDVFSSNQRALRWYERLGLLRISENSWKILLNANYDNNDFAKFDVDVDVDVDVNGFMSLFINKIKVATVINGKTIIVNDLSSFESIPLGDFNSVITKEDISSLYREYEFYELEKSFRMSGFLKNVKEMLAHV